MLSTYTDLNSDPISGMDIRPKMATVAIRDQDPDPFVSSVKFR